MFAGLANVVTKHSKVLIALWIVIVLCALPLGLQADDKLEYELTNMVGTDSESAQGNALMDENFSNSIGMDEVLVIKYPVAQVSDATTLGAKFSDLLHAKYSSLTATSVGSYHSDGSDFSVMLFSITSTDSSFSFSTETGNIRGVVSDAKAQTGIDLTTYVTGNAALTFDTMDASNKDVRVIDVLSIVLIFVLLAVFFGAIVTCVVPPLGFGAAFAVALLSIYLIGSMTGVFYLTKTLVTVTMLGAGCDYGIFIITRYREELKRGADHNSALKTAIEWAGESVFTSGMSVIIGFACLAICDFALVRSMGIVLALGIVFALASALLFVPALVNVIGEKVFWPNTVEKYRRIENGTGTGLYARGSAFFGRYFKWVAKVTRRYSKPIVVLAVLISIPSIYVYATSTSSYDMISVEPDGEAKEGLYTIMDQTYGGTLMPTYVVVEFEDSAVDRMGVINLSGTPAPYLQWSEHGLKQDGASFTGYVPVIMTISDEITAKNPSIVAQTSGLNSWSVLFALGQKQATVQLSSYEFVHQAVYDQYYATAFPSVLSVIQTNYPSLSAEEQNVLAQETTATQAATYADANTPTDAASLQGFAEAHINDAATVEKINLSLLEKMPSAVYSYVKTYLYGVAAVVGGLGNVTPTTVVGADGTNPVYFANLIDYVLDIGTGLVSDDGKAVSIMVVTTEKPMSDNTMDFIPALKDAFHGDNGYDHVYSSVIKDSKVCGTNAVMYDVSGTVSSQFTVIEVVVVVLLLVLLFVILGCYLTPVRAMVCILLSVIWTLALTFVVFQNIVNVPVCWIVPIVLFVVLLGLGMDYDIFVTTRVRENRVRGMSNDDAIDSAICSASGVISLCALIMGGTFLTLLLGSSSMLWEFGFALGLGILIDGLFMVTYVGPAVMHLMGDWSWKGPAFLQRKHSE